MADGDEDALGGDFFEFIRFHVVDSDAIHRIFGDVLYFIDHVGRFEDDFVVRAGALEHNFRGAKFLAAMQKGDAAGEASKECGFLHRGVATTNYDDFAIAEKCAVAGGAGGDTVAQERLLRFNSEHARGGSGRDDECLSNILFLAGGDAKRALAQIDFGDCTGGEFGAEALGLFSGTFDQVRTKDAFGEAGKILDFGG